MYRILICVVLVMLAGCASTSHTRLTTESVASMKDKTIRQYLNERQDFSAIKPSVKSFLLSGGGQNIFSQTISDSVFKQEGNKLVADFAIEDPSWELSDRLLGAISEEYNLVKTAEEAQLLWHVWTRLWGFQGFMTDWNNYRIFFVTKFQLLERESKAILAEGECRYKSDYDDTNDAPNYDELIGNQAERLKSELVKAIDYCEQVFRKDLLHIN